MNRQQNNEPGLDAIREAAPEWANYLIVLWSGNAAWAESVNTRVRVDFDMKYSLFIKDPDAAYIFPKNEPCAIHLPTGTVHIQQPDGSILEVTRQEWDV
jgi:hypothetical protein